MKWQTKTEIQKKTCKTWENHPTNSNFNIFWSTDGKFYKNRWRKYFFLDIFYNIRSTLFFHRKVYNVFFHTRRSLSNISFKKICMARNWHEFCLLIIASWCSLSEPDTSKHTIWKQAEADETNLCQKIFLLSWFEATPKKTKGMYVLLFSVASSAVHAPARRVSESIILELFCVFRAWLHSHVTCRLSID